MRFRAPPTSTKPLPSRHNREGAAIDASVMLSLAHCYDHKEPREVFPWLQ
jgi:hypothetical protein